MFQFPEFPTLTYVFSKCFILLQYECFHIRIPAGRSLFAAHRSFSQLIASFIGSWCQGIHLMLFFAWTASLDDSLFQDSASFAWASQIIVWVAGSWKDSFKFPLFCFTARDCSRWLNCSFPRYGKTFNLLNVFLIQLSVSFLSFIRFSMSIFAALCGW